MCNLYKLRRSSAEVASIFNARVEMPFNAAEEVLPGYPGMAVRAGDTGRVLQSMVWGFPQMHRTDELWVRRKSDTGNAPS